MRLPQLASLLERIRRDLLRASKKTGEGSTWTANVVGEPTRYVLNGVPNHDQLTDDLVHAIKNLWDMKDHLIKELVARSTPKADASKAVLDYVRDHESLKLVADLANTLKHAELDKKAWTAHAPRLGTLRYQAELPLGRAAGARSPIKEIIRRVGQVEISFDNQASDLFQISLPILDANGKEIAEAGELILHAHEDWSAFMNRHGVDFS